jgi:RNase P subunit RPR2
MNCKKCKSELNFESPEMTLVSDENNQVIVIICNNCGESYEVIYSIAEIAEKVNRIIDEVAILIMDLVRKGKIEERKGGAFGVEVS